MKRESNLEFNEWIEIDKNIATIGILKDSLKEIGEIVNIQLPAIGRQIKKREEAVILESSKSAIELYSPLDGEIIEINSKLQDHIELLNRSPEKDGWLFKMKLLR